MCGPRTNPIEYVNQISSWCVTYIIIMNMLMWQQLCALLEISTIHATVLLTLETHLFLCHNVGLIWQNYKHINRFFLKNTMCQFTFSWSYFLMNYSSRYFSTFRMKVSLSSYNRFYFLNIVFVFLISCDLPFNAVWERTKRLYNRWLQTNTHH